MDRVAEDLRLRCPHCGHVIATIPEADALRTSLICPACGGEASRPSALGQLAVYTQELLNQAIDSLDRTGAEGGLPPRKDAKARSDS